jgi:hypothetical protein
VPFLVTAKILVIILVIILVDDAWALVHERHPGAAACERTVVVVLPHYTSPRCDERVPLVAVPTALRSDGGEIVRG